MNQKLNIDYSIISRGTEKYNKHGYIAISEKLRKYKYILNIDHGVKNAPYNADYLKIKSKYKIENIAFSRFQLVTALMYEKHKREICDNILILGFGNIGMSCLLYLLDKKYNNITIYVRKISEYMLNMSKIIKQEYKISIKFITSLKKLESYNLYIETTGSSNIIKKIFENIDNNKKVIILSTPRDETYLISPLIINRKNLVIIGGHELNGIDIKFRNKLFNKLLKININKKYLKEFVSIYTYSIKKLKEVINKKNNFIEMFKY